MVDGDEHRREAVHLVQVPRTFGEGGRPGLEPGPEPQREAGAARPRRYAGPFQRRVHLPRGRGAQRQRRVGREDDLRLRHAEAPQLLDAVRLAQGYDVHAAVQRRARALDAAGVLDRAYAASPYIMTRQPRALAARSVKR